MAVVTWRVKWTNPAGSTTGDVVVAEIQTDPKRPGQPSITVPKGRTFVIKDMFKNPDVTIGGSIEFVINDLEVVYRSPDVNVMDPNNPSRPLPPDIYLYEGDNLKLNVYVNANPNTSDVEESVTLVVEIIE